eukprot:SAG22_NODE_2922_length_2101_cov_1.501499_3_plen_239_part_00
MIFKGSDHCLSFCFSAFPCGSTALTDDRCNQVNQDPLARPMAPVSRQQGLEVWQKPLSGGRVAVVFFNRNMTGYQAGGGAVQAAAAHGAGDGTAPPLLRAGLPVSMGDCSAGLALSFDTVANSIAVLPPKTTAPAAAAAATAATAAAAPLCLGSIGTCRCSNPPSPRVGLVACAASDKTQRWKLDTATGEIDATAFAKVRPPLTRRLRHGTENALIPRQSVVLLPSLPASDAIIVPCL